MTKRQQPTEVSTPAAARYLEMTEGNVRRLADLGRLAHRRNDFGARMFKVETLEEFRATREASSRRA